MNEQKPTENGMSHAQAGQAHGIVQMKLQDPLKTMTERNKPVGRMLMWGAVVWTLYSIVQIVVNGVILEEAVTAAQIITGTVQYPHGHPHEVFYPGAPSLPNYLSAAFYLVWEDVVALSAVRNFWFLFLSTFVPFALTVVLTRSLLWGFLAGFLTLAHPFEPFYGRYPIFVFPDFHGHGHIGLHMGLLTIVLLLGRFWLLGGALLGLLPAIHPLLSGVVWVWSGAYLLADKERRSKRNLMRLGGALCAGLAISATIWVIASSNSANGLAESPYSEMRENSATIRENFLTYIDSHSTPLTLRTFAFAVNPVALIAIFLLLWGRSGQKRDPQNNTEYQSNLNWILLVCVISWLITYGGDLWYRQMGSLPGSLALAMTSRFANLATLTLIPLTVVGFWRAYEQLEKTMRPVAIGLMAAVFLFVGGGMIWERWRISGNLLIGLWALLFVLHGLCSTGDRMYRLKALLLGAVLGATIFVVHSWLGTKFLACACLFSAVIGVGVALSRLWHLDRREWKMEFALAVAIASVLIGIGAMRGRHTDKWFARLTPFDQQFNAWLHRNARPGEPILGPINPQSEIQIKTGHPVLFERETVWLMTYMPELAPVIGEMINDFYGFDLADTQEMVRITQNQSGLAKFLPSVSENWKTRTVEQWRTVGKKYGFRLILSTKEVELRLPAVLEGKKWTLYTIPEN